MSDGKHTPIRHDSIQGAIVHEYDGIEEADNQLPLWWLMLFFFAIVFGIGYWFSFHRYGLGDLPGAEYAVAKERLEFEAEERAKELASRTGGGLESLASDPGSVSAGRGLFAIHCVACHGPKGQGQIGPNLTDGFWIHSGDAESVHQVIEKGVLEKGMPAWGPVVGPLGAQQLTAFVLSMRGTNVEGKEPQGEPWQPEGEE